MYTNPYYSNNFFEFFITLFSRIGESLSGSLEKELFSDELQLLIFSLIVISCSTLGVFLVLRKMTMLANGLSHTVLLGIVTGYFFTHILIAGDILDFSQSPLQESIVMIAAVIMAFLTTFLTQSLVVIFRLREDVSCGIIFTFLFALGVIAVTLVSRSAHIGTELLMGSADSLDIHDLYLQSLSMILNICVVTLLYRGFFVTSFDPIFSHILGFSPASFGYILMGLTALTATAAFRAVGVLMVLALFVGPPLIARLFTHRLLPLIFLSCGFGLITALSSVALSRHLLSVYSIPVSTSALLVSIIFIMYFFALLINRRRA